MAETLHDEFTIEREHFPNVSAWGTFRLEAYPITTARDTGTQYQYSVLYLDSGDIVAYGGTFPSANEAMANASLAMWQWAETGENAHIETPGHALKVAIVRLSGAIRWPSVCASFRTR